MMESNQNKMGWLPMPKLVITMSLPLMLSLLIQSLYNIVDSVFAFWPAELAAVCYASVSTIRLLRAKKLIGKRGENL